MGTCWMPGSASALFTQAEALTILDMDFALLEILCIMMSAALVQTDPLRVHYPHLDYGIGMFLR
jgi:hypothetical protein